MMTPQKLNPHGFPTTPEIDANLIVLANRTNLLWAELPDVVKAHCHASIDFVVTSGLRDEAYQQNLIDHGVSKASKSNHLIGAAVDIFDPTRELDDWLAVSEGTLVRLALWIEMRNYTPGWAHLQIFPPRSGKRFFVP